MNAACDPGLDAQMRFSQILPDFEHWLRQYAEGSAAWRTQHEVLILPYGTDPRQHVRRVKPAAWGSAHDAAAPPLAIAFVHGGYWRAFDAADHDFVARGLAASGHAVWNLEYRLQPAVRLAQQIGDVAAALEAVAVASGADGRPARVLAVGHSAGAHLVLRAAEHVAAHITGVVAVSGLYDLQPVSRSFLQSQLNLSADEIAAHSPLLRPPTLRRPHVVVVGEAETPLFHDHADGLHAHLAAAGVPVESLRLPGLHHMATEAALGDADSLLARRIRQLATQGSFS
jgi:arylformamidase